MATRRKARKNTKPPLSSRITPEVKQQVSEAIDELVVFAQNPEAGASSIDPKAVTGAPVVTVRRDDSEVREEKQEEQKLSRADEKLLKAVEKLTKSMDIANDMEKQKGIGGYVKGKLQSVKNLFSIEGLAGLGGIKRDDGSLAGAILESLGKRKDIKKERIEYVEKFKNLTELGRSMTAEEATVKGRESFDRLQELNPKIKQLEEKKRRAEDFGGSLGEEDAKELEKLTAEKKSLSDFSAPTDSKAKPASTSSPQPENPDKPINLKAELVAGTASGIKEEILAASPEEREALRNADPQYLRGVFEGAFSEVLKIEEDQLAELIKIQRALKPSEEERLETVSDIAQPIIEKQEKDKKENGSFIEKIFGFLKNGFAGMLGSVKDLVFGLLGKIPFAGAAVGSVKALLEAGSGIMNGAKRALPTVLDKGKSAASKAGSAAMRIIPQIARVAAPAAAVAGAGYTGWQVGSWLNDNVINPGVEKLTGEKGQTLGGAIYDFFNPSESNAEKPAEKATPRRETLSQETKMKEASLESMKKPETTSVVNNSPTTIINNNGGGNGKTGTRAPVRNIEPTYNRRLEAILSGA